MFGLSSIWIIVIIVLFAVSVLYEIYRTRDIVDEDILELLDEKIYLKILLPCREYKSAILAEQLYSSLSSLIGKQRRSKTFFSLEIAASKDSINFYIICSRFNEEYIKAQIYAQYPDAHIEKSEGDYLDKFIDTNSQVSTTEIELQKDFILPFKTYKDIEGDSLASLLGTMSNLKENEFSIIQYLVRPIDNAWQRANREYVRKVKSGINPLKTTSCLTLFLDVVAILGKATLLAIDFLFFPDRLQSKQVKPSVALSSAQNTEIGEVEKKALKNGYEVYIRLAAFSSNQNESEEILNNLSSSFKHYSLAHLNGFRIKEYKGLKTKKRLKQLKEKEWLDIKDRFMSMAVLDVLNTEELATLFHFPASNLNFPTIQWIGSRKSSPPANLPIGESIKIAKTDFRGNALEFGIKKEDRRRHMYMVGKTGTGKSTLLKNMIVQDIVNGEGISVFDPHGDLINDILSYIPSYRINDVVVIDPSDIEHPVGINLFESFNNSNIDLIANNIVEIFKRYFDSWGPRLEYVLYHAVLTLLNVKGTTLMSVQRILTDENYREYILNQIKDPLILKFWSEEYASILQNSHLSSEVLSPIQNKVGRFLASPVIRNILGQEESTIVFEDIIKTKKILLINLSQGRLGEETSSLLGSLLVSRLYTASMESMKLPEESRVDHYLYVDEFQRFASETFVRMLAESRKYKLNLILANQYIEQLPIDVVNAIFGNVGTLISFLVGNKDGEFLAKEFYPIFDKNDLVSLEKYHIYIREMINQEMSTPFSATTLPFEFNKLNSFEEAISASRDKYSRPKEIVEEKIKRWAQLSFAVYPKIFEADKNYVRDLHNIYSASMRHPRNISYLVPRKRYNIEKPEDKIQEVDNKNIDGSNPSANDYLYDAAKNLFDNKKD